MSVINASTLSLQTSLVGKRASLANLTPTSTATVRNANAHTGARCAPICALNDQSSQQVDVADVTRRNLLSSAALALSAVTMLYTQSANAAVLEADEDEELLEKVKSDRGKRLAAQKRDQALKAEGASLQSAVNSLGRTGQLLDESNVSEASSLLGGAWVDELQEVLKKESKTEAQKSAAGAVASSLATLQSAVSSQDLELSRTYFSKSAKAFTEWTKLAGFAPGLLGL